MRVLSPEGKPSRGELILFAGIVVTAIIFRFITLTKDAFWIDEGLTWAIVDLPFSYLWTVPFDAHPPLYYTIQKAWMIFGDSEFAMRSLSALLGLALPAVMFPFIRKHLGLRSAALVACLVLLSYTLIVHSSTIRSYALLLIFGTTAAIQIIELTSLSDLSLKKPGSPQTQLVIYPVPDGRSLHALDRDRARSGPGRLDRAGKFPDS